MYYGLLRVVCYARKVQYKDVSHESSGRVIVKCDHMRKRKNKGFTYHIPSLCQGLFSRYKSELDADLPGEAMYLRLSFHKGLVVRKLQVDPKTVSDFVKRAYTILGVNQSGYTAHYFRRSAATQIADAGVSLVNLKRHGQWKSDNVAEAISPTLRSFMTNVRCAYSQRVYVTHISRKGYFIQSDYPKSSHSTDPA